MWQLQRNVCNFTCPCFRVCRIGRLTSSRPAVSWPIYTYGWKFITTLIFFDQNKKNRFYSECDLTVKIKKCCSNGQLKLLHDCSCVTFWDAGECQMSEKKKVEHRCHKIMNRCRTWQKCFHSMSVDLVYASLCYTYHNVKW